MGINKPVETSGSLESTLLSHYERLEASIRDGELTPAQADVLMQQDRSLAEWLRLRASARLRS